MRIKCPKCGSESLQAGMGPNHEEVKPYKGRFFILIICGDCGEKLFRYCKIDEKEYMKFMEIQRKKFSEQEDT